MDVSSTYYRQPAASFLKKWDLMILILGTIDIMSIIFSFQCAYFINYPGIGGFFFKEKHLVELLIPILPFWLLVLYLIKFTQIPTKRYKVLFFLYFHSALLILFILIVYYFVFNLNHIPRFLLVEISFFGFLFLFFVRVLEYLVFKNSGTKRHIHKNIVIITDDSSIPYIDNIISKKELGYKVSVIFTESDMVKRKFEKAPIILPEKYLEILDDLIEVDLIDEVFLIKAKTEPGEVREILTTCEDMGVTFRMSCNDPKISLSTAVWTNFANGKFLSFINISNKTYALALRKTLDVNLALLMIVILSPAFLILSILIKLTSRGPVIIKEQGVGGRGRQINLYKFRTISIKDKDESNNQEFNKEMDCLEALISKGPRVTKTGNFLIKSGLNRLPKLFNVLKGDITVIGPSHPLHNPELHFPDR